jgi:hypothetical protein
MSVTITGDPPRAAPSTTITTERLTLETALAGEADFTIAPDLDSIKALPALVVGPALANWLDASSDSGPGRMVRYGVTVEVVVNAQEPIGALADLEAAVERALERIPRHWRFDRAEGPRRDEARGGEITALVAPLSLSMRYSLTTT